MKYRKYMRQGFFFTTTEHRLSARLFGLDLPLAVSYDREVAPRWKWTGKVLLLIGTLLVGMVTDQVFKTGFEKYKNGG